jgi:hypothetical protein
MKLEGQVSRYVVLFNGYNSESEENCNDYTSYSTKLDGVQGMTKSYSMAVASADANNGTIFAEIDGQLHEVQKKKFKS